MKIFLGFLAELFAFFAIVATAALFWVITPANAMEFQITKTSPTENALIAEGEIYSGDAKRLLNYLHNNPDAETIRMVYLNSNGGLTNESYIIADVIHELNLTTVVPTDARCESACFELWASGKTRVAGPNAHIGVHRVSWGGREDDKSRARSIEYATYISKFGVPRAILASMMMQPAAGIYYLTDEDMASMHAFRYTSGGNAKTAQPAPAPAPAQSFSVTTAPEAAPTDPQEIRAQKRMEFDATFAQAYEISKTQNRGRAASAKNCDRNGCEAILAYRDKNGYYVALHKSLNTDSRALCRMTRPGLFEDEYRCKNWLTGESKDYRWSRDPLM
jgi:hypothetical protein